MYTTAHKFSSKVGYIGYGIIASFNKPGIDRKTGPTRGIEIPQKYMVEQAHTELVFVCIHMKSQ